MTCWTQKPLCLLQTSSQGCYIISFFQDALCWSPVAYATSWIWKTYQIKWDSCWDGAAMRSKCMWTTSLELKVKPVMHLYLCRDIWLIINIIELHWCRFIIQSSATTLTLVLMLWQAGVSMSTPYAAALCVLPSIDHAAFSFFPCCLPQHLNYQVVLMLWRIAVHCRFLKWRHSAGWFHVQYLNYML